MSRFLSHLFKFFIPIITYFIIAIFLDPNGLYFTKSSKIETTNFGDKGIIKLKKYVQNPNEIVFLGDSKIDQLITYNLHNDPELKISNLAFGGSNIHEIEETFNFLIKYKNPNRLYIGINFHNYNMSYSHNRVKRLSKYIENPLYYLISKDLFHSIINILNHYFLPKPITVNIKKEVNKLDQEKDWDRALETLNSYFNYYSYPKEIEGKLLKIKRFCEQNDIELIFIISPIHKDVLTKVKKYNLQDEYEKFKNFIFSLCTVYDFSNLNKFTNDKSNFNDPYHLNKDACIILFDEIFNPNSDFIVNKISQVED